MTLQAFDRRLVSSFFAAPLACAEAQTALPPGHPSSKDSMGRRDDKRQHRARRGGHLPYRSPPRSSVSRRRRGRIPGAPDFDGAWKLGYARSAIDRRPLRASSSRAIPPSMRSRSSEACPALDHGIDEVTGGK